MVDVPLKPMTWQDLSFMAALATAFAAVVISPLVQLRLGTIQSRVAQAAANASQTSADAAKLNAENAGRHALAKARQEWITLLRSTIVEHHALLLSTKAHPYPDDINLKALELGTRIELLLNMNEAPSQELMKVVNDIYYTPKHEDRLARDVELLEKSRIVLKQEWDRVRAEYQGFSATTVQTPNATQTPSRYIYGSPAGPIGGTGP